MGYAWSEGAPPLMGILTDMPVKPHYRYNWRTEGWIDTGEIPMSSLRRQVRSKSLWWASRIHK